MHVDAIPLEETAEQNHFRREKTEPRRDRRRVFAQHSGGFIDDFHHAFVAVHRAFENDRRQSRDVHFVRGLGPADQFVAAVQTQGAQNRGGKLGLAPVQIVFAQNETQRLEREEISAASIAQNVTPPSGFLDPVPATPGD